MSKISLFFFIILNFFYLHSMHKKAMVGALVTSPIILPAIYHDIKTAKIKNNSCNTIKPFRTGLVYGSIPPFNIVYLGGFTVAIVKVLAGEIDIKDLVHDETRAFIHGFTGGISLYATIPLALKYLKKIK